LKKTANPSQDFFAEIMEKAHPGGDFIRTRPWGSQGGRKKDGSLRSARTRFQVASGFPLVGLCFYGWFVPAYRKSLLAPHETSVRYKLLALSLLAGLHAVCQLPLFLQGPRDQYR
jgi:hypothetical protein